MEYILIFIAAVFVNNVVLAQFLGICPFLGVSKKVGTAAGMGAAVTFVLTIATIVTFLVQKYILDAFGLGFMRNDQFYPDYRRLGTDGGNHIEEGLSALIKLGRIPSVDHHELLYPGCSYPCNPKEYNLLESVVYASRPLLDLR